MFLLNTQVYVWQSLVGVSGPVAVDAMRRHATCGSYLSATSNYRSPLTSLEYLKYKNLSVREPVQAKHALLSALVAHLECQCEVLVRLCRP